jgi:hypothetical protein
VSATARSFVAAKKGARSVLAVAATLLALNTAGSAFAAPADQARMSWTDLRETSAPGVDAIRELWQDRLPAAQSRWDASGWRKVPVPAFTLTQTFAEAKPPVLVSILFNLYDCELPGNGAGADLFARCPMRVVSGPGHMKTFERVCHLYVPPAEPGQGPDPVKNYTAVSLDASRTLHLRVVQYGRPVPACDGDVKVD